MHVVGPLLAVGWLVLGIFQFFAIMAGLDHMGFHWFIAGFLSMVIAGIPLLGSLAGVYGAVNAWDWTLFQGLALFFGPFLVLVVFSLVMTGLDRSTRYS